MSRGAVVAFPLHRVDNSVFLPGPDHFATLRVAATFCTTVHWISAVVSVLTSHARCRVLAL